MAVIIGDDEAPPPRPPGSSRPNGTTPGHWSDVPWRTIAGTVLVVVAAIVTLWLILSTGRIITWVLIAGFFAIVLAPAVKRVESHVGGRRTVATSIVMFTTLLAIGAMVTLFIMPIRRQLLQVITDLPGTIESAGNGRGPVGSLVTKLHLVTYVRDHQTSLQATVDRLSGSVPSIVQNVLSGLLAFVTIFVLAFFFLSQSRALGEFALGMVPARRQKSVQRVAADAARAISGYMIGNLLISLLAGISAFVLLVALGIPNPAVIALWVAFADMIPLVGATIGAVVAVAAGFFTSTPAGVIALIFFVLYQQTENSFIQPKVMSKRVNVNPLAVLLSVLIGVELFGFVGALLSIPVAGALQVAVRAVIEQRHLDRLVLAGDS